MRTTDVSTESRHNNEYRGVVILIHKLTGDNSLFQESFVDQSQRCLSCLVWRKQGQVLLF
jgi:hypothetical protein